jgi:hypothetical protein
VNLTPDDLPFERLGEYDVLAPISEGGMASVWLGRATAHPERLVALKVIRPEHGRNKDFVAMFVDESRIASRLAHPNIVSIVGVGYDGNRHFLAMEVLRGHTLLALCRAAHAQGKRLPYEVVAWMGARVSDALHHAHELLDDKGALEHLVHRDVNPANIFITREGVPKLIDFGLAKARDRIASTAIGVVKGKLAYLAPEQAQGHPADRRSDVFALGVTLWETTLDRRLFLDDTDVETIRRVRETQVPDPTTLDERYPRALADTLCRALARNPNDRWQTAAELRDALDGFVSSVGRAVDAADVRALLAELFGSEPPLEWERWVDEATADREKTRVWEGEPGAPPARAPESALAWSRLGQTLRAGLPPRLLAAAAGCSILGALFVGLAVRGCRGSDAARGLEQRVARIEGLLGIDEAGPPPGGASSLGAGSSDAATFADDRAAPCALAKVAGYQAWQESLVRAKANSSGAMAACSSFWSENRRQACYYAAMSGIRATQAARDAVIAGGAAAREAVRNVKDDPKNEAIARARSASETAFAACEDDGGS